MTLLAGGLAEGIWGLLQLAGVVAPGHSRFPVTGSFYNPGPYGCFMGCMVPVALWVWLKGVNRASKLSALACLLLCALLLPGGMSRSGWLAAAVGSAMVLFGFYRKRLRRLGKRRLSATALSATTLAAVAVAAGCAVTAWCVKPDSARGRLLIWKTAAHTASEVPACGVGWDCVAGAYGERQERYFASGQGTDKEKEVAGCPETVFNEYLQIAIAFGIPAGCVALLMFLGIPAVYARSREYGLSGCAAGFAASCLSSYPLQFWEFRVLVVALGIGAALCLRRRGLRIAVVVGFAAVAALFCVKAQPLDIHADFYRAKALREKGMVDESTRMLKSLLLHTSDPMPLNLIGRNYLSEGRPDSAEHYFLRAIHRVPNRHYPHYLLMKLYEETDDSVKAREEAAGLLNMPVKVPSKAIREMKTEARRAVSGAGGGAGAVR